MASISLYGSYVFSIKYNIPKVNSNLLSAGTRGLSHLLTETFSVSKSSSTGAKGILLSIAVILRRIIL